MMKYFLTISIFLFLVACAEEETRETEVATQEVIREENTSGFINNDLSVAEERETRQPEPEITITEIDSDPGDPPSSGFPLTELSDPETAINSRCKCFFGAGTGNNRKIFIVYGRGGGSNVAVVHAFGQKVALSEVKNNRDRVLTFENEDYQLNGSVDLKGQTGDHVNDALAIFEIVNRKTGEKQSIAMNGDCGC